MCRSRFLDHEMLYYNTGGKKGQYLPDLLVTAMVQLRARSTCRTRPIITARFFCS